MKYKMIQRANPQDRTQIKWYAAPVNEGRVTQREIAADIVELSSLSRGDISNVIESLITVVPRYLMLGRSVNLGDLGTLRISFGSEGVDDKEQFVPSMIKGVKVVFTPSVQLKDAIEKIRLESAD
ncbi:HU family DNA-binding protein [Tannerella forsythia]|uniref:DNA-binding protein n=1 Tax=Tannerella forsythia TaxID=28112 RepID=A0A3P1XG81_TANFO|nr:HU family DNA-binding protein [Tannerella forsythia]RRD57435.1 DNA-binding protein [Tannerella forsythia]RRD69871.1 DNA-binding protein [Tannerella forsythia]